MSLAYKDRKIAAPSISPDTKAFWDGCAAGKLLLKQCEKCQELHYYPRPSCPFCGHGETKWVESKGTGTIYTYSVTRRVEVPYCFAFVTLDEGVTMMTNIADCDLDSVRIGQRVRVVFKPTDGGPPVPMFTPA